MTAADRCIWLACGEPRCRCAHAAERGSGLTHCPCLSHADIRASLSVADKRGRLMFRCMAGCSQEQVIDALRKRGLWGRRDPDRALSRGRGPKPAPSIQNPPTREVRHPVRDPAGQVVALHCRVVDATTGKKTGPVWWELPDGTRGLNGVRVEGLPLFVPEKGAPLADLLDGSELILVEGEPAAAALAWCGLAVVATVTGAGHNPE